MFTSEDMQLLLKVFSEDEIQDIIMQRVAWNEEVRQEEERKRELIRKKEEEKRLEQKRKLEREKKQRMAEEMKRRDKETLDMIKRKQQNFHWEVRLLGEEGVGKTSLIKALVEVANLKKETVFLDSDERCSISWKGGKITFTETSFSQLQENSLKADLWYLIVAANEGPIDLEEEIEALEGVVFCGVFYNKCDYVDDEELIDLVSMEVLSILEENGHSEELKDFRGAAVENSDIWRNSIEELLDDIVSKMK